ncbi:Rab3 GTPase-activating protein regulatory subunit N-terminus-domain-containing protein [Spinellus fusiger]|nr:Rab3 GTPase-activating protein regulatory subunit N-terminus-domain-containing protein [Spinellus fusiger]
MGLVCGRTHPPVNNVTEADLEAEAEAERQRQTPTKESYLVSASPSGRHLVLAYKTKFVTVEANPGEGEYSATGQGSGCDAVDETITAILCLPRFVPSLRKRLCVCVCVCVDCSEMYVMVGYSTGWLRIFSETGTLVTAQLLEIAPLLSIKMRTPPPIFKVVPSKDTNEEDEEITLLFGSNTVVSIDGQSLWTGLRASERDLSYDGTRAFSYKKWTFQQQQDVRDVVSLGPCQGHPLDQPLLTTRVFSSSATARFLAVGTEPMLSFYATQDTVRPLMSAMSMATYMVSRVVPMFSYARSWWPSSTPGSGPSLSHPPIEPALPIPCPLFFSDACRHMTQISVSPVVSNSQHHALAVTSDVLGRVILWDVEAVEMVRMWKGVRDATCGWIEVTQDTLPHTEDGERERPLRVLLFLVMYSTRRGSLKIVQMRHGRQVGFFHLGPGWHLVQCGGEPLGSSMVSIERRRMAMEEEQSECGGLAKCILIGPGGEVRNIVITLQGHLRGILYKSV